MYAYYDSTAAQPAQVLGWFDEQTPAMLSIQTANILPLTQAEWDNRLDTPYVQNGVLVVAPPQPPALPQPDPSAFITACKSAIGGIVAVASNPTLGMWSLTFNAAVQAGDWADVQTLVEHAQSSGAITAQQYADIKAAAATNNITGVTL